MAIVEALEQRRDRQSWHFVVVVTAVLFIAVLTFWQFATFRSDLQAVRDEIGKTERELRVLQQTYWEDPREKLTTEED